jgi:RNA polymerase sigma-70 factor, ECF subfamily
MGDADELARDAAASAARGSYGKLVAFLAARTRDLTAAEDALADAFAEALAHWPSSGVPDNPDAWLLAVARRKASDAGRKQRRDAEFASHLALIAEELAAVEAKDIPDDRLALMFACAHPAIEAAVRAPLILQTVLGFDAAAIASAFLIAPATMSQRLVRAKAKIKDAAIPFRVPGRDSLRERLEPVLDAIYATYAEGWVDAAGTDARRRNLAAEGLWLGRLVASLLPDEPEALGLLALMLHAEARRPARRDAKGEFVPLAVQNPRLWDGAMIEEAEMLLFRASAMRAIGRFQLEAAVQSAHAVRRATGKADWQAIVDLYDGLLRLTASPVVAINRAVAVAETKGATAGLDALEAAAGELSQYQPYWAARAELLARAGDKQGADAAFERAIGLEFDDAVRRFLQHRRATVMGR